MSQSVDSADIDRLAQRLVTPRFITISTAALFYFISFTMLLPTLPRYVEAEFDGSSVEVGVVVGAFGVSAAIIRPLLGRLGDRYGRRVLLVLGALTSGSMALLYPVWLSIPVLVFLRVVTGIGEAGAIAALVALVGLRAMPDVPAGGVRNA